MQTELHDVLWLSQAETVSLGELAGLAGLTEADVRDLVDCGALAPANPDEGQWIFTASCVVTLRRACRLRSDLELDTHTLALTLNLIEQIDRLESEVIQLRAQLPQRND